jgi:hypothetical protein
MPSPVMNHRSMAGGRTSAGGHPAVVRSDPSRPSDGVWLAPIRRRTSAATDGSAQGFRGLGGGRLVAIPVSCEPVRRVGRSGASGAASGSDGAFPGEPPKATSGDRATDRCYADAGRESRSKPQDVGVWRFDAPLHVVRTRSTGTA